MSGGRDTVTVQDKIDALLRQGGLLMESPCAAECSSDSVRPGVHVLSDHPSVLDHDAGHFCHLYDPLHVPPGYNRIRRHYLEAAFAPVLRRVEEAEAVEAVDAADHAVVCGAFPSEVMDAALSSETVCFVLEPSVDRFVAFLENVHLEEIRNTFFLAGSRDFLADRVDTLFDAPLFTDVFPVFFRPENAGPEESDIYLDLILRIETYYYRRKIYPLTGHGMKYSFPYEEMRRELFYDQQKHVYENLPGYVCSNDLSVLEGILPDTPALIAAAGPELDGRLEFIRRNRDGAVLICLNNALKTLVAADIIPDIVLVVDPSVEVESCFEGVKGVERCILVAHNYAGTAGNAFGRTVFFGESLPALRRPVPSLAWHGSVLAAGFSLAEHMGCPGCVLVGAQLCGETPYGVEYSVGSVHAAKSMVSPARPSWLRLMPVRSVSGRRAYASLNFLDTALWLNAAIRRSSMRTGVLSDMTLLRGTGDPEAVLSAGMSPAAALDGVRNPSKPMRHAEAVQYARNCLAEHRAVRKMIGAVLDAGLDSEEGEAEASVLIRCFKDDNTAYLVQRFPGYSEVEYQVGLRAENGRWRLPTMEYFLRSVDAMLAGFQQTLKRSLTALNNAGRSTCG